MVTMLTVAKISQKCGFEIQMNTNPVANLIKPLRS